MAVLVLDKRTKPLMPCAEKRARLLLERGRAVVHRMRPFTIRLKDRTLEESNLQPLQIKIDPGSKTTGVTVIRADDADPEQQQVVMLIDIEHRGQSIDAACVGPVTAITHWNVPTLTVRATGRGSYQRTRLNRFGFPRGYLMRQKQVQGFQTGDLVQAQVPTGKKAGTYQGRVAIRATGSFNIQTPQGVVQGISHRHCRLLQRADGYGYTFQPKPIQEDASRAV